MKFDEYIGIDWSGAKVPQQSFSIALASCTSNNTKAPHANLSKLSRTQVYTLIGNKIKANKKVLIGIDCNFGYANHIAQKQYGKGTNYRALWKHIDTMNLEHSNFFAGNTWSNSPVSHYFWTTGKAPNWFIPESLRRYTETASAEQGLGVPESPYKLIGAKQVGKGGLAGMRMLHALKKAYGDKVAVWPFEQHLMNTARVVLSEIYPRLFIKDAGFGNNKVRDIDSLNKVLKHFNCEPFIENNLLNDHLSDAIIAAAGLKWHCEVKTPFDIKLPQEAIDLEGWIFGVS